MSDDQEFEQLRREYHQALGKRALEAAQVLESLVEPTIEVGGDAWTRVLYIAHKTAGLAATYDMPLLTELCAALDEGMQRRSAQNAKSIALGEFREWCEVLAQGLRFGSQGKDAVGLELPPL